MAVGGLGVRCRRTAKRSMSASCSMHWLQHVRPSSPCLAGTPTTSWTRWPSASCSSGSPSRPTNSGTRCCGRTGAAGWWERVGLAAGKLEGEWSGRVCDSPQCWPRCVHAMLLSSCCHVGPILLPSTAPINGSVHLTAAHTLTSLHPSLPCTHPYPAGSTSWASLLRYQLRCRRPSWPPPAA